MNKAKTPEGRAEITRIVSGNAGAFATNLGPYAAYAKANAKVDRKNYSDQAAFIWEDKPYKFSGDAFRKTADPAHAQRRLADLDAHTLPVSSLKSYSEMSDAEKQTELSKLLELSNNLELLKDSAEGQKDIFATMGIGNPGNAAKLLGKGSGELQQQAKKLHQIRTIQHNLDRQANATTVQAPTAGPTGTVAITQPTPGPTPTSGATPLGTLVPVATTEQIRDLKGRAEMLRLKAGQTEIATDRDAAAIVGSQIDEIEAAVKHMEAGGALHPDKFVELDEGAAEMQKAQPADFKHMGTIHWQD